MEPERIIWVADRGFASAANRAHLTRGGGHYIHAEKLRRAFTEAAAALARPGRYATVAGDPQASGSWSATTPNKANGTPVVRSNLIAHLGHLIDGSDTWTARKRDELVGSLKTKPGLRRFLRRTKAGMLRIDNGAAKREAHLDGKWLLRTSDATLTPEDRAAAYKHLLAVERGWRDMKGALGLRPVFRYREDGIRGHVQLCWLALLLIRVAENTTGDTWRNLRHELDRMHLVTLATPARHGRPTLCSDSRPEDHPGRPRAARTTTVFRLHHPHQLSNAPTPKHAVVTRPQHTKTAFTLLNAHIQAIVCLSSAEVRPDT